MYKKEKEELYKEFCETVTKKHFLKTIGVRKKDITAVIKDYGWKEKIFDIDAPEDVTCLQVFNMAETSMAHLSKEPDEGWIKTIHEYLITELFPEKESFVNMKTLMEHGKGIKFYIEVLRCFLNFRDRHVRRKPAEHLYFLKDEEVGYCTQYPEYNKLKEVFNNLFVLEFLQLSREVMPFDLYGHVSGVHYIAVHMARQLEEAGIPVDLALISGAAITHDIGKFGCSLKEVKRIPYLHYYYTDEFLQRWGLSQTSHIAGNHSTWDLEIENLSAEALLLIYSDFRVKSHMENGKEIINFYTLEEAFNVILNKLDNVDETKEKRYRKVYAKLKDFEDYMISLGVNTDPNKPYLNPVEEKPSALMEKMEVVTKLKYLAVEHNIRLMDMFNRDYEFNSLLEAARSDRKWKNLRAYLNIFREYNSYMTKAQKQKVLEFMLDLLVHRQGDIRRDAAEIIGDILSCYEEEYRKEIPEGAVLKSKDIKAIELWGNYLKKVIIPDHKVTNQNRRWMGYTIKLTLETLINKSRTDEGAEYIEKLLDVYCKYSQNDKDELRTFILLDTLTSIPLKFSSKDRRTMLVDFVYNASFIENLEISIAALEAAVYLSEYASEFDGESFEKLRKVMINSPLGEEFAVVAYLKFKIMEGLSAGKADKSEIPGDNKNLYNSNQSTGDVFRENLKVDTPWIIKSGNIKMLLESMKAGKAGEPLHIATHLSNLLKVCDKVTVRYDAGDGLIIVADSLSLDQRNEIAIELIKGLEIGEYEYSKYIPKYLGKLSLKLHEEDFREIVRELKKLTEVSNQRVVLVALDTLIYILKNMDEDNPSAYSETENILGILLKGIANYNPHISREAFALIGNKIFGDTNIDLYRRYHYFNIIYKKMTVLIEDRSEEELTFFNSGAALNNIYRFISEYLFQEGNMQLRENRKIAFFPGTYDPFSAGHHEIANIIRNRGFEVYLAVDEFSWSKKVQPRKIRQKIVTMSTAQEKDIYVFPANEPINIANEDNIKTLKKIWKNKELYIVVGSDVVRNALSYKKPATKHSVQSLNHIIFSRQKKGSDSIEATDYSTIRGNIIELNLPPYLEDVSSTKIRDNIDMNRDISNIIDRMSQNYIYEQGLYNREPQYKSLVESEFLKIENIEIDSFKKIKGLPSDWESGLLWQYLNMENTGMFLIRDSRQEDAVIAMACVKDIATSELYGEFQNFSLASKIRKMTSGRLLIINKIFVKKHTNQDKLLKILLNQLLIEALRKDYNYAIYSPVYMGKMPEGLKSENSIVKCLTGQGFKNISDKTVKVPVMAVDLRNPVIVFENSQMMLKSPFNKNRKVLQKIYSAREKLQESLRELYPGELILSVDSNIMQHKLLDMVTKENQVDRIQGKVRRLGKDMCVPFGEILKGRTVPNTVTKSLHTEKVFEGNIEGFSIKESPYYESIENQIKTVKAFNRPVILLDDFLHSGHRFMEIASVFERENVNIKCIIVGLLSASGKDIGIMNNQRIESVYFVPNLKAWFMESDQYPFIGGDAVETKINLKQGISTINLILPFALPGFLKDRSKEAVYNFSKTCLENARDILIALQEEFQTEYGKKLTVSRMQEAFTRVCIPDTHNTDTLDDNKSPSDYVEDYLEKLQRLKLF